MWLSLRSVLVALLLLWPSLAAALVLAWDQALPPARLSPRAAVARATAEAGAFVVQRTLDGTTWEEVGTLPLRGGTEIRWTEPTPPSTTPYVARYRVVATRGTLTSESSNEVTVTGGGYPRVPQSALRVTAVDSEETKGEDGRGRNAIDGNAGTFWHSQWSAPIPPPPHWIVLDLGQTMLVDGLAYLPRTDKKNGTIAGYEIALSRDGTTWAAPVSAGTWTWTRRGEQIVRFPATSGRYVRLRALTEVSGNHNWTSAAEIGLYAAPDPDEPPPPPGTWTCATETATATTVLFRCTMQ